MYRYIEKAVNLVLVDDSICGDNKLTSNHSLLLLYLLFSVGKLKYGRPFFKKKCQLVILLRITISITTTEILQLLLINTSCDNNNKLFIRL